jgi:hypothetical protein
MPELHPLTNLELTRYGNLVGVDWEGTSLKDVRRRIQEEDLTARQVRDKLRSNDGAEEEARRDHNDIPTPPRDDDDGLDHYDPADTEMQRMEQEDRDDPGPERY